MKTDLDEKQLFQYVKKYLAMEAAGSRYAVNKLKELKKIAVQNNLSFYEDALFEFDINSQESEIKELMFLKYLDDTKLREIINRINGRDGYLDNLKPDDIINYFFDIGENTAVCRVEGDSMIDAGLKENYLIIYDKTSDVKDGDMVLLKLNDKKYLKRYRIIDGRVWLFSENLNYPPYKVKIDDTLIIYGIARQATFDIR